VAFNFFELVFNFFIFLTDVVNCVRFFYWFLKFLKTDANIFFEDISVFFVVGSFFLPTHGTMMAEFFRKPRLFFAPMFSWLGESSFS